MAAVVALVDRVRERLVSSDTDPTPAAVASVLRSEGIIIGNDAVAAVVGALQAELIGAGPLEPLLRIPGITDIVVNAPDSVWVDRGDGLERADAHFASADAVRRLAQRLAASIGRRLDDATPYVDARLADGTRFHAVLPPIGVGSTLISLRIPSRRPLTLEDLVSRQSIPEGAVPLMRSLIESRAAFLVTGGTGCGKTTVLATLLGLCPPHERILIVEDSAELRPQHPHVVRMESRLPNIEGAGAVTLQDLVRQALRMRPDRLVVGEVRGAEVVDLLAALNTGHEGGCGTLHANSVESVPARLEALGLAAGLPRAAVHSLAAAGFDVVVHVARLPHGQRRIESLGAVELGADGMRVVEAFDLRGARVREADGARQLIARGLLS